MWESHAASTRAKCVPEILIGKGNSMVSECTVWHGQRVLIGVHDGAYMYTTVLKYCTLLNAATYNIEI